MSDRSNQCIERIAPGFWRDANGNIHISIPELLSFHGLPNTPENRSIAENLTREALKPYLDPFARQLSRTTKCPRCGNSESIRCTKNDEKDKGDFECQSCGHFFDGCTEEGFAG